MRCRLIMLATALCATVAGAQSPPTAATTPGPMARGIVTLVQPRQLFYTNLGSVDGVPLGARVTIWRGGATIGTARVIQVCDLDSIARLEDARCAPPRTGDYVTAPIGCAPLIPRQFIRRDAFGQVDTRATLPWSEPHTGPDDIDRYYTLYVAIIGAIIIHDTFLQ